MKNQGINYAYITPAGILKITDEDKEAAKSIPKTVKLLRQQ